MFGEKPSWRAAAATRSLVSARSLPCPFSAFDAVPIDTPACAATSLMVVRLASGSVQRGKRFLQILPQMPDFIS